MVNLDLVRGAACDLWHDVRVSQIQILLSGSQKTFRLPEKQFTNKNYCVAFSPAVNETDLPPLRLASMSIGLPEN